MRWLVPAREGYTYSRTSSTTKHDSTSCFLRTRHQKNCNHLERCSSCTFHSTNKYSRVITSVVVISSSYVIAKTLIYPVPTTTCPFGSESLGSRSRPSCFFKKSVSIPARNMRRYGSEPIEGLTVWGKWDSELYIKHNEDVEGEHGWSHFKSESLVHHETIFFLASRKELPEESMFSVVEIGERRVGIATLPAVSVGGSSHDGGLMFQAFEVERRKRMFGRDMLVAHTVARPERYTADG